MLWFDDQAEEVAAFSTSVFPDSEITGVERFSADVSGGKAGAVSTVSFTIGGTRMVALNGGSGPTFDDSVSFVVECADQAEIDRYWDALTGTVPPDQSWKCRYGRVEEAGDISHIRWSVFDLPRRHSENETVGSVR